MEPLFENDTKPTIVTIKDHSPASFVSDFLSFPDDIKFNDGNKFYDVASQINIKKIMSLSTAVRWFQSSSG